MIGIDLDLKYVNLIDGWCNDSCAFTYMLYSMLFSHCKVVVVYLISFVYFLLVWYDGNLLAIEQKPL